MNKTAKLFMLFALLMTGTALIGKAEPKAAEAVSSTRLYVRLNDSILARAPAYKLYTGSTDVSLIKLSPSDNYTYYTDAVITNWMTLKNDGGNSINLYNISNAGVKSTWDQIVFNSATITNWNAAASYTTSVYTPPGVTYNVSLYNGETLIGTQIAYENTTFTPSNITVTDYVFKGWYTDAALTTPYTPTILTEASSLYGKYEALDMNRSVRVYIASDYSWWYDSSARIDIYYWKTGSTAVVQTMRKEVGNLHSVVLENASFTHIKLERRSPTSPYSLWNATGDIPVNLLAHNIIKFSGPLNGGYTGPFTVTDFANTAPDVAYLKTQVPLLTCSNYSTSGDLLSAYNRLGDNELEVIDALTVKSHDNIDLSYSSVINYYNGYRLSLAPQNPFNPQTIVEKTDMNIVYFTMGFGSISILLYFFLKKKKALA